MRPVAHIKTTAVPIINLSASGSAIFPKADSTCQRRASTPSSWSVKAAAAKKIPAPQAGPSPASM